VRWIDPYGGGARRYDVLSGERLVYRAGRVTGIDLLQLQRGDVVLDVGCGTGLNLPLLAAAVGPTGLVIGLDRSPQMLAVAQHRITRNRLSRVRLLQADATAFTASMVNSLVQEVSHEEGVDAVFASYAMSVIPDWHAAWRASLAVLKPGGRAGIVDMQPPIGWAKMFSPLAYLACAVGGSDIHARPWTALETDCVNVVKKSLRGGHIVASAGRLSRQVEPRRRPRKNATSRHD
jgi:ubiquinone/menaquinone biosynthesis C-methylase UbiE